MDILEKNFDISNTIEVDELAKRWGVSKKTIDNRRYTMRDICGLHKRMENM